VEEVLMMSTNASSPTVLPEQTTDPVSFDDRDSRKDEMHDLLESWAEDLTELTDQAQASQHFQEWLDVHSRFHDYSHRNTLLIKHQCPEATKVAGFWTWQNEFDRHVKEGESAIWIWAPIITEKCPKCGNSESYHDNVDCKYHEESDPDTWGRGVVGFRPTSVFDFSQTDGEPLPELDTDAGAGAVDDPGAVRDRLLESASEIGVDVDVVDPEDWTHGNARGICTATNPYSCNPMVKVRERENDADLCRTLIHEYAHARLHFQVENDDERAKREVEAESVAYLVSRYLGFDPENSKFYLATWSDDDADTIQDRLSRITDVAAEFIDRVQEETTK
jgi:hypothetical protein